MTEKTSFIDLVTHCIESGKVPLPVFSATAVRIQEELARQEQDIGRIEKLITTDQSLASEVLKIANSAFYRGLSEVTTVRAAIVRLGVEEIGKLVLVATTKNRFSSRDKHINLIMRRLWQHSAGCAYGAAWLAKRHDYGVTQSQAFFSGLLHDVGKLFILLVIEYLKRKNKQVQVSVPLIQEAMEKLHCEQGYRLMCRWNMPTLFAEVVRDHHAAEYDQANTLLALVRMANMVCHKLGIGLVSESDVVISAAPEVTLLNLTEVELAQLEIALEDVPAFSA